MAVLLETLINASEKAACIARSCCTGVSDETLVVAEKCDGEANTRFDKDFKTIADVLAQESAKVEIASCIPELAKHVRGEECAEINGICIELKENSDKTCKLLSSLVPPTAAKRMAEAAHSSTNNICDLPEDLPKLNYDDLGVWIDPIDATAEFIAGVCGEADADHGLSCVTVLIGAYLRSTGEPVVGVINQPFYNDGKGRIIWGVSCGNIKRWGGSNVDDKLENNTILMSSAENCEIIKKIEDYGWKVKSVPGAGHKLLKVALGEADAYILSKGTTFRWDTCSPHAILRARGGDLLNYTTLTPIKYNNPLEMNTHEYCNSEGIIAYVDQNIFHKIKSIFN